MERVIIYQLFVRHFSNFNSDFVPGGSREQNGCGTFHAISDKALLALKNSGITHLWCTGVLEHENEERALMKGKAGSPYAVRDYYSVSADYALYPEHRLAEFALLIGRAKQSGLKVIIDFIPNHVARSYGSKHLSAESLGAKDQRDRFFARDNHFYYLEGEGPLRLPTAGHPVYEPERTEGRVTGNNAVTWSPTTHDWYETVKLNYGFDFRTPLGLRELPGPDAAPPEVPRTWRDMLAILDYWADFGVQGVRVDMAHLVPLPFWKWVISALRKRYPSFYFFAEAYANDPAHLFVEGRLGELAEAGFDAYYDQELYHTLKAVVEGEQSPPALARFLFEGETHSRGVRYIENHDEVRCANPAHWGDSAQNLAAVALAWLLGRGPIMLYNGQEVGEPAVGAEGYSGDDGRSSIFDYTRLPALQGWTNAGRYDGGQLSEEQKQLRAQYVRLLRYAARPVFERGVLYGLNYANPRYDQEGIFAFLRSTGGRYAETILVVCALQKAGEGPISICLPYAALDAIDLEGQMLAALCWSGTRVARFQADAQGGLVAELLERGEKHSCHLFRLIPVT